MGNLMRMLGAVIAWFCIATLLAQVIMISYLWSQGRLNREKVSLLAAVVQGVDLRGSGAAPSGEQSSRVRSVSLDGIEEARAARFRQLELREQALVSGLKQIRFEKDTLTSEKERFERVYNTFIEKLGKDKVGALAKGNENARLLLESIKPKQSKELIMLMLEAEEIEEVVTLFEAMPIAKRAKIAAEFKTEEEAQKLSEILRRVRLGLPDAAIIDEAQQQLQTPNTTP